MSWNQAQAARRKKKIKLRRQQGLCTNCGTGTNKLSLCNRCNDIKNERQRGRRLKRNEDGLCPTCGDPLAEGLNRCRKCYERKKKANERYRRKKM